ncbi:MULTISPECIES: HNH endonuclease [Mesoplasma]|nr:MULTISPECIES: HNH endonuclease signature motif containing protein [Mesoplasma]
MDNLFIIGILLIGVIFIIIISFLFSYRNKKIKKQIVKLSQAIKKKNQIDLNFQHKFKKINNTELVLYFNHFNGKRMYENFSLYNACYDYLYENETEIKSIIKIIKSNINFKKEYEEEIDKSFVQTNLEIVLASKIKVKKFYKYEKEIYFSNFINPVIEFKIYLSKEYVTPAGRNSYKEAQIKNFYQILEIWETIKKDKIVKSSEEFRRKYERSLVSDKVRIQIFNRDNLTCQVCGDSKKNNNSIVLHIDHKVPIAKGGDSNLSNLWTLCKRCNLGKSDLILENIIN